MGSKVIFPTMQAAEAAMGHLFAAGRISAWNAKRTKKGISVRYLTACRRSWFDLIACDMDRFFPAVASA